MILAFDLGLKATGIAHDDGSDVLLCPPGLRKSPMTDARRAARREWWVTSFVRLVEHLRPDEVWVEAPIVHMAHPSGQTETHRMHGWLDAVLSNADVPRIDVTPAEIKQFATGHGRASKADVIAQAWKHGWDGTDDNEADAWWLHRMATERRAVGL